VIDAEKANYPVAWMCPLLGVPRSSFYAWRRRAETTTAARRRQLAAHVRRIFDAGRGAYGCRRVTAALNREGHECSVGLVAELMRQLGLRGCQPRAYKRTTVPGKQAQPRPDLIGRDFTATEPGSRLVGDITYLRTGEGWLYLATVIDLATRMVVGRQLAEHMRAGLVVDALAMAVTHGHVRPGAVFHSDRGAQPGYTSEQFARACTRMGVVRSMGRVGSALDNAVSESFNSVLKVEYVHRHSFATRTEARLRIATWITGFYNTRRRHSAAGGLPPVVFGRMMAEARSRSRQDQMRTAA
jgi:putative transposase